MEKTIEILVDNKEVKSGKGAVVKEKQTRTAKKPKVTKNTQEKLEKNVEDDKKINLKDDKVVNPKDDKVVEVKSNVVEMPEKSLSKFERNTRISKTNSNQTYSWLYRNRQNLKFDLAVQRNEVWNLEQKSLFIHSIVYGYPVPQVHVKESNDGLIWLMDGKQRLTTIISYMSGEFALSKKTPSVAGFEIATFKFADLPQEMQDIIKEETINIVTIKNITEEEEDEMFVRLNNGSSLTKMELTRAMYSDLFAEISKLATLPFFVETLGVTNSARNRFVDQEVILQTMMLLEKKTRISGFGANDIRDYVLSLKDEGKTVDEEMMSAFIETSSYLYSAMEEFDAKEQKAIMKKVNAPIIFELADSIKGKDITPRAFEKFLKLFFIDNYSVDTVYGKSCQGATPKKDNVVKRYNQIHKAFKVFEEETKGLSFTDIANSKFDTSKIKSDDIVELAK